MKKINNYSTQYKIIQPAQLRDSSRAQLRRTASQSKSKSWKKFIEATEFHT